jgi:putative transposase
LVRPSGNWGAHAYLSGTNTRRVRRALAALFGGAVGKDTVSRVWRKTKGDWDVWNARSLADEPIIRLILDGTVVRACHATKCLALISVAHSITATNFIRPPVKLAA